MPEPMKPKLTEVIHDMLWACGTLILVAIQSIPLALAILVALALWFLPEAIGWHQSWAHIIPPELNRAGAPHALFSITKRFFVASWVFAFFTKLLVLQDEQNLVVQQRLVREKRRNEAVVAVKHNVEKLEKPLADEN